MRHLFNVLLISSLIFIFAGCSASQPVEPKTEDVIAKRLELCPWCMSEPEVEGSDMFFVGLSNVYKAETEARSDAVRDATRRIVEYLGAEFKSKYEQARVSYGLSGDAIDPVGASRDFERMFSENVTRLTKTTKWYVEREETATGRGYKYFVLARIPKSSLDDSFKQVVNKQAEKAKKTAAEARDEATQGQAEKAAKMWADMQGQGVMD
ncbi:MAG: hypothetical protein HQ517_12730 [SAR324 cluster bacterium]|nr:hypothetical protein [SAR324 cluster bacterium]